MALDFDVLKTLREETGVSFSMCKKALEETNNDIEKAKKLLSKWGVEHAAKKTGRQTNQGAIFSYIHHNKKIGCMVELLCETDFVANNTDFQDLGTQIALQIAFVNPENVEELQKSAFVKDESKTIDQLVKEAILKIGENIQLGKFTRFSI